METKLKATLRIPTNEQYAYVEAQVEGTREEIVEEYKLLTNAVRGGFGLEDKLFNKCLDEYLNTGTMNGGSELYAQMSLDQQNVFQQIKKSFKRNKYKEQHED